MRDRAAVRYTSWEFLRYLNRFDRVKTNQLHVAMGAALLGKGLDFYPNAYWKNQAVFESTLRSRFPNIRYRMSVSKDGREKRRVHHHFPSRGRGSAKNLKHAHLFHFVFLYHNRTTREKTVEKYIEMEPCSEGTHLQIYLFEDTAFEAANVVEHLDDEVSSQAAALAAGARAE